MDLPLQLNTSVQAEFIKYDGSWGDKYWMNQETKAETLTSQSQEPQERKPNEDSGLYYSGFLKITDPTTGQVLVQTRAD
jgi:hypothetical protein